MPSQVSSRSGEFLEIDGPGFSPVCPRHRMRSGRGNQSPGRRHDPPVSPQDNRIYFSESRHQVPARGLPGSIWSLQNGDPISYGSYSPAADGSRARVGKRSRHPVLLQPVLLLDGTRRFTFLLENRFRYHAAAARMTGRI
jgi:hypothetical protein